MSDGKAGKGLKSAYELALERLESQGIERPREDSLAPEQLERLAEVRSKAKARLAELEIMHRDRLASLQDPAGRSEEETNYQRERRRIEDERDHQLEQLRKAR